MVGYSAKDSFDWTKRIRQPEYDTPEDFKVAKTAKKKKKPGIDLSKARLIKITEGLCVQIIDYLGLDGHNVVVEGIKDGVYHIVNRWVPKKSDPVNSIEEYFFNLIKQKFGE
jgi:hypothetical protein